MPTKPARAPDRRLASIGEAWRIYRRNPLRISGAFAAYAFTVLAVGIACHAVGKAGSFGLAGTIASRAVNTFVGTAAFVGFLRFALACMKEGSAPSLDLLVPDWPLLKEALKGGVRQFAAIMFLCAVLVGCTVAVGLGLIWGTKSSAGFVVVVAAAAVGFLAAATFVRLAWAWMFWQFMLVANRKGYRSAFSQSTALTATMPWKLFLLTARLLLLNVLALGVGWIVTVPVSTIALYCACRTLVRVRKADGMGRPRPAWQLGPAATAGLGLCGAAFGALVATAGIGVLSGAALLSAGAHGDWIAPELASTSYVETDRSVTPNADFRYFKLAEIGKLHDSAFRGMGTGFFVNDDGDMITNRHVVEKCGSVMTRVGEFVLPVKVADLDEEADLAHLKVAVNRNSFVALPQARDYRIGQEMFVFGWGHPAEGSRVELASTGQLQSGMLNATRGIGDDERYFQMSATLNPGNSGGAVVDRYGLLAGVATQSLVRVGNPTIGFGLKLEYVADFLRSKGVRFQVFSPGPQVDAETIGEMVSKASRRLYCLR